MSIASHSSPLVRPLGLPPEPVQRLSVGQYQDLVRAGSITDDDRCELIDGWLFPKMTKGPQHERASETLRDLLEESLPEEWICRSQGPLVLSDSMPEPDISVVPGPRSRYDDHHPGPADAKLVVEVADSTLTRDRTSKLRAYARAGIREYWIVNLVDRQIEVHTEPQPDLDTPAFARNEVVRGNQCVELTIGERVVLRVCFSDLVGHSI